jgi:double-stranded uracil-DNA glycosylase
MGERVETLEDLLRPGLCAVCVGINPSPVSVEAGHYYQGALGQRFYRRLRYVGLLDDGHEGFEDDAAFASGVGFTDIVKRPTRSAAVVSPVDFEHGQELLEAKLAAHRPGLVIFTFKKAAESLFGSFVGNGFVRGLRLAHSEAFVMPAPYESNATVYPTLDALSERLS